MLALVKKALRISTDAFNDELEMLIAAAYADLGIAGVTIAPNTKRDEIVKTAVCTYCKLNFGIPDDADRLKRSYDEQKAQLSMSTGYTDWSVL